MKKCPVLMALTVISFAAATTASGTPGTGDGFVPYKAIYALTFHPDARNQMKSGSGRMTIEFTGSKCTEYKIVRSMTHSMRFEQGDLKIASEAVTTENPASTQMAFSYVERHNGNIQRQETVTARRDATGIVATSAKLPGGRIQLPAATLLPIQSEFAVIDAMTSGRKSLNADTYNPEISPANIDRLSVTIGDAVTSPLPKGHPAAINALAAKPRYRTKLVFADGKTGKIRAREQLTRYISSILTVSDTALDHLKIDAKIVSLTILPQRPCP